MRSPPSAIESVRPALSLADSYQPRCPCGAPAGSDGRCDGCALSPVPPVRIDPRFRPPQLLDGVTIRVRVDELPALDPALLSVHLPPIVPALAEAGQAPPVAVETVQAAVAAHFRLTVADLLAQDRHRTLAGPRQLAMYLARKLCDASFPELGQKFERDHSTVQHACRKVTALLETDLDLRRTVRAIEQRLDAPAPEEREEGALPPVPTDEEVSHEHRPFPGDRAVLPPHDLAQSVDWPTSHEVSDAAA